MNSQSDLDNATVFARLQDILGELRQQLDNRFELHRNPATHDLQNYSSLDGEASGSLTTFLGDEVNLLVHSRLRNPAMNFSTMRLTTWLNSHIQVPHLTFDFGIMPNLFFYMDYIPRVDLWTNLDYVERYYEPINPKYLGLAE